MANKPISATVTRCCHNRPLVVIYSQPFNGLEIRPEELRDMAQRLVSLADLAETLPTGDKHFSPVKVAFNTSED